MENKKLNEKELEEVTGGRESTFDLRPAEIPTINVQPVPVPFFNLGPEEEKPNTIILLE